MAVELMKEKYNGAVNTVEIGSGERSVKIGGATSLPFLFDEGAMPYRPVAALEILDMEPSDWPDQLKSVYGSDALDPVKWAKSCVNKFGAKALCVKLQSVHPDFGARSASDAAKLVKKIHDETKAPLIILGSGDDERDNEVLPKVSQTLKGANCLFGVATQNNYKTLTATCLADGHSIIAESPIDVNIAKQLNILISDMGFDPTRILMHPTATSLGYGSEYVYSIMERSRLAAFMGDKMLSQPFALIIGSEVWRVKEAKDAPVAQGVNWEVATSVSMLQAGGELLIVRHPDTVKAVEHYLDNMTAGGKAK